MVLRQLSLRQVTRISRAPLPHSENNTARGEILAGTPATSENCSTRGEILAATRATSAHLMTDSCNLSDTLNEATRDQGATSARFAANFCNRVDTRMKLRDQSAMSARLATN